MTPIFPLLNLIVSGKPGFGHNLRGAVTPQKNATGALTRLFPVH